MATKWAKTWGKWRCWICATPADAHAVDPHGTRGAARSYASVRVATGPVVFQALRSLGGP